ncbi:uncharacterized protein KY384_000290 [Bacidia gigantensis]|uniref:uncharacterized protein n=1 Tax=Bacidia gigantensis TaxID=2732470 RepID=UPI001D041D5C|nr:uncharacterized protein KY384_000290 [Bacidia gigantensis]KAG8526297.1 hypothetical protein KY384_000290 [Bacidia gigantensis]
MRPFDLMQNTYDEWVVLVSIVFMVYVSNIIRVGPNTVLFNSPSAYKDIYSHKANTFKDKFYSVWKRNEDDKSVFNTTDIAVHSRKRKIFNTVFTDKSIRSAQPFIINIIDRWNDLSITGDDWSEPIDLAPWIDYLVFDILGDLCFGESFRTIEPGENVFKIIPDAIVSYMNFWNIITKSPFLDLILHLKPRGLNGLLDLLTPKAIQHYYDFLDQKVSARIASELLLQQTTETRKGEVDRSSIEPRKDMLHHLLRATDPTTAQPAYPSKTELLAEANVLVIAGSHTTSTALVAIFFYLTHSPRVYRKLTTSIRDTFASPAEIVDGSKLSSCVYLRACIDEALRLAHPGPSEMPRRVLQGGASIDGVYVPEGTTVGFAGWASGHDRGTYGDDFAVYRPERWIVGRDGHGDGEAEEKVRYIRSAFHPFTAGPGNCVGQNLAGLEMMLICARTLWRMDVRVATGTGEGKEGEVMEVEDAYIALPKGVVVQFRRREFD